MENKWIKNALFLLMMGAAMPTPAQEHNRPNEKRPDEIPSPESNARRISKEVKKAFQLTDEQYTKVYELYLKEQKAMLPDAARSGNMPQRGGMGRPPQGGGPDGQGGPGMGGGMPPQGGDFAPGFGGNSPKDMKKVMEEQEKKQAKARKKLEKKMKKLLNNDQYIRWKTWETERQRKDLPQPSPRPMPEDGRERPNSPEE